MKKSSWVVIKGASEHNLKSIDVSFPKHKLVVITGVSGSGKSSLAFDVLYKEAQRRYLSVFIPQIKNSTVTFTQPKVASIQGISPAVMLKQYLPPSSPRSTLGTLTEAYDLLRLLYAKVGTPYCPFCQRPVSVLTTSEIFSALFALPEGTRLILLAPIEIKSEDWWKEYLKNGFIRARINREIYDLSTETPPSGIKEAEIVIDRLIMKKTIKGRLLDSVELALKVGKGCLKVIIPDNKELFFCLKPICPQCKIDLPALIPVLFSFNSPLGACPVCHGLGKKNGYICPACQGKRLKKEALSVKIKGKDIAEVSAFPLKELLTFLDHLSLPFSKQLIATPIISALKERIAPLIDIGLGYLSLDYPISQLSTGEYKRLLLAQCLNHKLSDVLFILDEPSTGLHPQEISCILKAMQDLKNLGNTVLVVEHSLEFIKKADYVIELGPGAGREGGKLIFAGTAQELLKTRTLTAQYLTGQKKFYHRQRQFSATNWLTFTGLQVKNLKQVNIKFPLNRLSCVYGVSGSGKSALVMDAIYPVLKNLLAKRDLPFSIQAKGHEMIKQVVAVDARPIGRLKRANVATFTGVFAYIRKLFACLPEARARGYTAERFSFNAKSGRCEVCQGEGKIKIEMPPLPAVYLTCEVCQGKRFKPEVLEIKFKGKNIADVLEMTVSEALSFFRHIPFLKERLSLLTEVNLGYLSLGQSLSALSGGELQRLKLAKGLYLKSTKPTLYLLDEPTMGLHPKDINQLLKLLDKLLEKGHTIILISNHPAIIKTADYLVEIGPGSGKEGGKVLRADWNK